MIRNPRSSSCSGLSTQGTLLLALASVATAAFLFLLLPTLTAGRTAEARGHSVPVNAETPKDSKRASDVQLIAAPALEAVEDESSQATSNDASALALADGTNTEGASLAAAQNLAPEAQGPKLNIVRGQGKTNMVESGSLRAEHRKEGKKRRAEKAEEDALNGIAPEEPKAQAKPKGRSKPNQIDEANLRRGRPPLGKKKKKEDG